MDGYDRAQEQLGGVMKQTINLNDGRNVEVDVLACPFCGSQPDIGHRGNNHTKKQSIVFKCSNPDCRIERTDSVIRHGIDWIIPKSVESWNNRTPCR